MSASPPPADPPLEVKTAAAPEFIPATDVSPRAEEAADRDAGGGRRSAGPLPEASPATGLMLFGVVVMLFLIVGPSLQSAFGLSGLIALQITCVLVPSLLYVRLLGLRWQSALSLNPVAPGAAAGAALLGGSVWYFLVLVILPLQSAVLPPSETFLRQREALFSVPGSLGGLLFLWGAAALTPAICEEILFRGVLLHSSRSQLSDRASILLVSALFAVFHFNLYQLSITFLMGGVLGWLLVRTGSILCTMIFHLVNNTVVLIMAQGGEAPHPVWTTLFLVVATLSGLELIRRSSRPDPESQAP